MSGSRKHWEKPSLVVVMRRRAEEAVLDNCKRNEVSSGAEDQNGRCQMAMECTGCAVTVNS
jgi:ferredoxin